jgi:hypothetical protein
MNLLKAIAFMPVLLLLLLTGCSLQHTTANELPAQVDVFGVQLFSDTDYREINGIKAEEEPCLRGYERSFEALDIIIGYGFNGKIRKITTRNASTSMFGLHPGMTCNEGRKRILETGFNESVTPNLFRTEGYTLTFLVDDKDVIFGLTLQTLE